ncbi:putative ABC transporter ATP-binding protein YjkB [Sporosarcina luteola]|uniref:Putative ABC transporter ATP-binding protein YjkB n=1 Tax=Sporosarcina luteola TaxID=582850 RepID=A0A511Z8U0_9BACL|nr:phosphate ABC transporter ATP-binding protein [Sporosarcina luteola]GEN83861.1 putative ABC transporter ATP-binding protein YjkB [Sporosarcina luteola]
MPVYKPALHFKNVSYTIQQTSILKNITGSFPVGKITTLVGPSGAGKTTLLKLCNGLLSPTEGEIYIEDQPIQRMEPIKLRRHAGIVLQNSPMIRGTVYDNLALPLQLQGKDFPRRMAGELLELVGLDPRFLDRNANDLSGGQQQKVSIGRTLANQSRILLLDEITSALDRVSLQEIEDLIRRVNRERGVTVIWITHNLEQAIRMADYAWVVMDGELIETGEADLLNTSHNDKVRQFVKGEGG